MKISICLTIVIGLICLGFSASADQFIYLKVSDFDPTLSAFDEDVAGNRWVETQDEGALFGTAYGAPGDNNKDAAGPRLVIKLPEPVKAGEATDDGKKWIAWARLFEPESLVTGNEYNSFFFRMSPDAKSWTPAQRASTALLWNDAGAANNTLLFPDSVNGVDVLFTDVGDKLPWFWENHKATMNAPRDPESSMDPPLVAGDNYVELVPRESHVDRYPRIEIICFRNDGNQPSDSEARQYLAFSVQPAGKLAVSWGEVKSIR